MDNRKYDNYISPGYALKRHQDFERRTKMKRLLLMTKNVHADSVDHN